MILEVGSETRPRFATQDHRSVAYIRRKTINGKMYHYLVKSVREGKRVRQVFVRYIGNPPPPSGGSLPTSGVGGGSSGSSHPAAFTPLTGPAVREQYVRLLKRLGCQSVVFSLRSPQKHGDVQAQRRVATGVFEVTKVRLHREVSVAALAHEVGHVLDYVLQSAQAASGSLDAEFVTHRAALRKLADYTCAHYETSSPDVRRQLKRYPASPARDRSVRRLDRYYDSYVYRPDELFARLVSVSFTEPAKARAIAPTAYTWLQETLSRHERIRTALAEVGLWPA
jgi:hypothetical protein